MKKKKKPTLADLETRMGQWLAAYVDDHKLLPLGKRCVLVFELEHHKTTYTLDTKLKTVKACARASGEPMTEADWDAIFRLPVFKNPPPDSMFSRMLDDLRMLHKTGESVEMPYHHVQHLNTVFEGNNLLYHLFKVSGSASSWRKLKFGVFKKL